MDAFSHRHHAQSEPWSACFVDGAQIHIALDYFMQRFAPVYDSLSDPAYHQKDGPRFFSYRQLLDPPTYIGKGPNRVELDRMTAALGQLRFGRPPTHKEALRRIARALMHDPTSQ